MSLKKIFLKSKITYKIYLYYNLYIRHKGFLSRKRYSQWGEDEFIAEFFKDNQNGIYLDIGCFNPFMYSNTCLLHKKGWSGINIDINPTSIDLFNIADKDYLIKLIKKYENPILRNEKGLKNKNYADKYFDISIQISHYFFLLL